MMKRAFLAGLFSLCLFGCTTAAVTEEITPVLEKNQETGLSEEEYERRYVMTIDGYQGEGYVEINGNCPDFDLDAIPETGYMSFSELDELGRAGMAEMLAGPETLPTAKRGDISKIKPTGWKQNYYDFVEQEAIYNRSHLLAHSLSGQDANEENLITGTRYMNAIIMEPFESMMVDYIEETGNHVWYRVTPIFEGDNLLASGVHMEACSIEDNSAGICFNIFAYNVQPGVEIDYETGENQEAAGQEDKEEFLLNTYKRVYHDPDCPNAYKISSRNAQDYYGSEEILIEQGYTPSGDCLN